MTNRHSHPYRNNLTRRGATLESRTEAVLRLSSQGPDGQPVTSSPAATTSDLSPFRRRPIDVAQRQPRSGPTRNKGVPYRRIPVIEGSQRVRRTPLGGWNHVLDGRGGWPSADGDGDLLVHRSRGVDAVVGSASGGDAPGLARDDVLPPRRGRCPWRSSVSTGAEAFYAAFARAGNPLGAARDAQKALQVESWPELVTMKFVWACTRASRHRGRERRSAERRGLVSDAVRASAREGRGAP